MSLIPKWIHTLLCSSLSQTEECGARYLDERRICSAVWWNAYHPECVLKLDLIHSQRTDSLMSCATHPINDSMMFFFFLFLPNQSLWNMQPSSHIPVHSDKRSVLQELCSSAKHWRSFIFIISCLLKRCLGTLSMRKPLFFFLISFFFFNYRLKLSSFKIM